MEKSKISDFFMHYLKSYRVIKKNLFLFFSIIQKLKLGKILNELHKRIIRLAM